jgi:hypothetical protein
MLIVTLFAHKAIKHIWHFFAALQLIFFFTLVSNFEEPASVNIFCQKTLDIINLKALFDLSTSVTSGTTNFGIIGKVGGIALIGCYMVFQAAFILLITQFKKTGWIMWLKNFLFYNFMI